MAFRGNTAVLRALGKQFSSLGSPTGQARQRVMLAVKPEIRGVLAYEFSRSVDPDDSTWQETAHGKSALLSPSKKLPNSFAVRVDQGVLAGISRIPRDWLRAHQEGHVFPARTAGKSVMRFNSRGRLISRAAFARALDKRLSGKNPARKRRYSARMIAPHRIGGRVLPQRRIIPDGQLTPLWSQAVARGVNAGLLKWSGQAGLKKG
jgi:hypothetical protein